jgi:hypothetical protein
MKISKSTVSKNGSTIIQYSEEFSACIKKFLYIVDSINIAWEGNDSLKYINTMKEKLIPGLEELNSCIKDYGVFLKNVPNAYDILDETFSTKSIDV